MKVAIVTGCAGGIGGAVCDKLLVEGYAVCGMDVASECKIKNDNFIYVQGDLSNASDRKKLLDTTIDKFSSVDVLVNVAGVAPKVRADLLEMTEESYDFVMDINTKGTLFLTQLVANYMISQGIKGYIVNISSMSAYTSSVNRGEYCISKAGVSMITKLFADRLASEGIMVNEIRPGIIKTGMTEKVSGVILDEDGKLKTGKVGAAVVGAYKKVEDAFVGTFIAKEGETAEEAKARVAAETEAREAAQKAMIEKNLESSRNAGKRN